MRLKNISTIEAANNYLDQFVKKHNDRFGKAPLSDKNIHRVLSVHMILDNILCYKTLRTVPCNLTFQHNRQLFLLEDNLETRGLRKRQISLCEYPEGDIKVFYQQKELKFRMIYDCIQQIPQGEIITDNILAK